MTTIASHTQRLTSDLLNRFSSIVGHRNVVTNPDEQRPYLIGSSRHSFPAWSPAILIPQTVNQVASILKLASETAIPLVTQGGNTGLVGGQLPHNGELVLSLLRMNRIREVDPITNTITCEAGVTLRDARAAAVSAGSMLPLLLPSEGSCTIGGNLATNAGGTQALAYGVARDRLVGLEVVLADGRIHRNLKKLKKDNTGYNLDNIFIGSEGTLGVITAAVLRMVASPRSVETAIVGTPSMDDALKLLQLMQKRTGGGVTSFELMSGAGLGCVVKNMPDCRDPMPLRHEWYLFIELSSNQEGALRRVIEDLLSDAYEEGLVSDGVIADTLEQTNAFWRLREFAGEAQRREGGIVGHDVSVPVASVPNFLRDAGVAMERLVPSCRPMPFGHLGDGNIHYTVVQPLGTTKEQFLEKECEITSIIHELVMKYDGSISAEHGIGVTKLDSLAKVKDPVSLDIMQSLKVLFDPKGILNPGKVLIMPRTEHH